MMTSLAQSYSPHPGGIQQHPGAPQGHPMAGVPHNPGQQVPGQPGMPQQMHMGVSGPGGPQVTQAGAMMAGMPPGAGGPSAHALQHLNPGQQAQAQMFQQQQAMFANSPQLQQLQQQQQIINQQRQQQAARQQALMSQQYSGMPMGVGVPNGMGQMTPAQFAALRSGPMARSVNLPQHLQQAQQQAQHSLEQQQAQQQAQQHAQQVHQQHMFAQQMALQGQGQGGNPAQQGQMNQQQIQNIQQAQLAAAHQQQQQAQAQAAQAAQQNQGQNQAQGQAQPAQPNPVAQSQQAQTPGQQHQGGMPQQQAAVAAAMLQQQHQRQGEKIKGQCLMRLMQFGDHLSNFGVNSKPLQAYMANGTQRLVAQGLKQRDDLNYWLTFVDRFFSSRGVLRHSLWLVDEGYNKQYEITFPALARYFHTHFESGITNMQMIMERGSEKELPNNGHYIESQKSSFVYWFDNGLQLIASGSLRAHFDADQKIELLEFTTSKHEEYLPMVNAIDAARPSHEWAKEWQKANSMDGKQSPEMNKKKAKAFKSPPQPPPEIVLPRSRIKTNVGVTPSVFQFLELAEVMVQMNPLFTYTHANPTLGPYAALNSYVESVAQSGNNLNNQGPSPAANHPQLPDGSPHISSPAQAPGMQLQQSQHGTSSSGPSANTSPNVSNKRRRPSTVKNEEEHQVNGTQVSKPGVKPSPRIGKKQKGNPA